MWVFSELALGRQVCLQSFITLLSVFVNLFLFTLESKTESAATLEKFESCFLCFLFFFVFAHLAAALTLIEQGQVPAKCFLMVRAFLNAPKRSNCCHCFSRASEILARHWSSLNFLSRFSFELFLTFRFVTGMPTTPFMTSTARTSREAESASSLPRIRGAAAVAVEEEEAVVASEIATEAGGEILRARGPTTGSSSRTFRRKRRGR